MSSTIISDFKAKITHTTDWLTTELAKVRTGRATPSFLDAIQVDSYGSTVPLNQVASVTAEDARTLRISPWDSSQIKSIETSIEKADLGVSTSADDKGVRVHFPDLTAETREKIAKSAKQKHEEARIALRSSRDEARSEITAQQKAGELSEDAAKAEFSAIEDLVSKTNKDFDSQYETKYNELTTI